jgi:hypothetical protein
MVPRPQYMQPAPMVEAPIQAQLTPDNTTRGNRRRKRKVLDDAVQGRTSAGRKPHIVRTNVPRTLDMSVMSWKEQSPDAIAKLKE